MAAKHAGIIKGLFPKIDLSFASRDISKSRAYSARFGSSKIFGNYEDALSSDIDIAYITTPHAQHSELAALAAKNKKDIIIEKPVTRNIKELITIEKAIEKNAVRCAVAENYFYKPMIKKIRKHIEDGLIGKVIFIELNKTNRDRVTGWRLEERMMGGGALLEGGVHWVNALVSLAGSYPKEVFAVRPGITYDTDIPFEDTLMLIAKFDNGIIGKLLHSWRIPNPLKGMGLSKIYGTDGIITFESNGLFSSLHGRKIRISFFNPFDFLGFKAMNKAFIENYMNNKPWQPSLERIHMELKLVASAYKSLKSGVFERI